MLAKLLTSLCLVALAAGIDDEPILKAMGINQTQYITVSGRLSSQQIVLYDGPHYYIEGCLGELDASRLCGIGAILRGIHVKVSDPYAFTEVTIDKKNSRVSFRRQGDDYQVGCPGVAMVDLHLCCDHYIFSNSRNRLRLPNLLASDSGADEIVEENDA